MAKSKLDILFLCDVSNTPPENNDVRALFEDKEWQPEARLVKGLEDLGHSIRTFALYDQIEPFIAEVQKNKPDIIFNQCEALGGNRNYEAHIVSLFELLQIPYTGCDANTLNICKDKGLAKKILSFHRIRIPNFVISKKSRPIKSLKKFKYPTFTKPLHLEASEGIAQLSFSTNATDTLSRVEFIHENFNTDAMIEEYIEGRELYVSMLGGKRPTVFPIRELFFRNFPEDEPKFATFKAKWDDQYREKWGIKTGYLKSIDPKTEKHILDTCKKIYKLFQINGYARIDLRLKENGEVVFLEMNPNPSIHEDEDYSQSAQKSGLSYEELLEQIIHLGLNR